MEKEIVDFIAIGLILWIVVSSVFLVKERYNRNLRSLTTSEVKQYSNKKIIIGICVLLPAGLYMILKFPIEYLVYFELFCGTMIIALTLYVLTREKFSIPLALAYPVMYFHFWNNITLNVVAMFLAFGAILIIYRYIRATQMLLVCVLIAAYDFVMVYITTDMISAAEKVITTELPLYVHAECTSSPGIMLGLGDIVFTGLLAVKISEWKGYDLRNGLRFSRALCILTIILLVISIQVTPGGVPATIPIMIAGLITIGIFSIFKT